MAPHRTYTSDRTPVWVDKGVVIGMVDGFSGIAHLIVASQVMSKMLKDNVLSYPILCPLVQVSSVVYGVLHGLFGPHGVGLPGVQDQVGQEGLVEGSWAHAVD